MDDQAEKLRDLALQVRSGLRPLGQPTAFSPARASSRARVLTVTSGKGGVGKSNLSINLALALCRLGRQVILFDADLGMANVDVLMGLAPRYNLQHVVQGIKPIQEVLTDGPLGLKVIASGNGLAQMANLSSQQRERLLSHFAFIEDRADYILVDTGAGISKNVLSFVLAADEVLVVTTPEPTARLDAYGLIKVVSQENPSARLSLVVNQVQDDREGAEVGDLMRSLAQRFLNMPVEYLGSVRKDPKVGQAVREQNPFLLAYPSCQAARNVAELAAGLNAAREEAQPAPSPTGFFARVARLFS
jgi:flagellar biosynthesis protein FlhG